MQIYLIDTNFRGHLISRKKSRHILRVSNFTIWVQDYFLRVLITITSIIITKMKKSILHFLR